MKNRMMQIALALGMIAATLSAQAGTFKLPEFLNAQQLTAWRAQHAPPATTVTQASDEQAVFFTGKPYDAASGTYLFKYRAYNPTIARWTSADPSGFPDSCNNYAHCLNNPLTLIDPDGLFVSNGSPTPHYLVVNHIDIDGKQGKQFIFRLKPWHDSDIDLPKLPPGEKWDVDGIYDPNNRDRVYNIPDDFNVFIEPNGHFEHDLFPIPLYFGWRGKRFIEKWKWPQPPE